MSSDMTNCVSKSTNYGLNHPSGWFFVIIVMLIYCSEVKPCLLYTSPELNVYKAAEWTSVALLSQLSVTNKGRTFEVPNFRANMPWEEKRITL